MAPVQPKSRTLAGALGGSSLFQYLTAAAPGLTELVTIGKVWDLASSSRGRNAHVRPRDRGRARHGPRPRDAPRPQHVREHRAGRAGGRHAERIDSFLRDPSQTGVLAVALPEEMPVNETVEFERALIASSAWRSTRLS